MKNKKIILLPGLFITLGLFLAGCKFHTYTDKNSGPVVKQTLSEQKFNSMKVSTDIVDTELHVGKTHKVIYRGLIRFKPSVQIKNGILTIKQENKGGRYRISKDNVIAIYLPAKELQKIDMHLEDGDVDFYGNIQAKNIALSAEDGDITIDNLYAKNKAKIDSEDGDIEVDKLFTTNGAKITSEDGDIKVKQSNAHGYYLSSDDGDVTFKGTDHDNDDDGGSYTKNISSSNVLFAHSDDGDVTVN